MCVSDAREDNLSEKPDVCAPETPDSKSVIEREPEAQTLEENSKTGEASLPQNPPNETGQDEEVLKSLNSLSEKIDGLAAIFKDKIMYSDHESKIMDNMHKELQKYKDDMYSMLLKPILLDIIELRESVLRVCSVYSSKPEGERNIPLDTFSIYADDVRDILERNGVEVYKSGAGEKFVPVRQKVIKKIPTDSPETHGKIAESLGSGYELGGRTIAAEKVTIYVREEKNGEQPVETAEKN
jgi:molecular chaperone GrpE (heat shock protein)